MNFQDFYIGSVSHVEELTAGKKFNGEIWLKTKANLGNFNIMNANGIVDNTNITTTKEVQLAFWIRLPKHTDSNTLEKSLLEENS